MTVRRVLLVGAIIALGIFTGISVQAASQAEKSRVSMDSQRKLNGISNALTEGAVHIIRQGSDKEVDVTMGEYQDGTGPREASTSPSDGKFFGAHLQDLTGELKRQLDIPERIDGVLVVQVDPKSKAEGVLRQNDVILQVNRQAVSNKQKLFEIMNNTRRGDNILLLVYSNGGTVYLTLAPYDRQQRQ